MVPLQSQVLLYLDWGAGLILKHSEDHLQDAALYLILHGCLG